jgi:hypothetical protein
MAYLCVTWLMNLVNEYGTVPAGCVGHYVVQLGGAPALLAAIDIGSELLLGCGRTVVGMSLGGLGCGV